MADLIISQPMTFTVDVKNGLVERPQRESLMRGDKMANRIIAELMYGSEPFDITGVTVKGKFCRPPNGDEIDLAGEAKGNVAEVQLTDQCYTSGGHYEARVILVLGEVERTVLFISGDVLKSGSGNEAGEEPGGEPGGGTGSGLPAGGTAGQVLVKVSSANGAAIWKTLAAEDVGARPNTWTPTAEEVGARPNTWTPSAQDVGALPSGGTAADSDKLGGKSADKYASYEYGTWTPKLTYIAPTSDPIYTALNPTGTYVKIGPMVYVAWSSELNITSGGAGSGGDRAIISGLPFASNANFLGANGFCADYYTNSGYAENPMAYIVSNYVELGYGSSWKEANGYGSAPIVIAAVYLTDQ